MARLEAYLNQPLAITLGWTLLHSLWQGTLIALIFAGCLALVNFRPQIRYLLGCAALLFLIVLPLGTGVALYYSADTQPSVNSTTKPEIDLVGNAFTTVEPNVKDVLQTAAAPGVTSPEPWVVAAWALLANSAPWLAGAWLLGVCLLLLRLLGQAVYVHRFRTRQHLRATSEWQARVQTMAKRLGVSQTWQLVQSNRVDSPLTFGVLHPVIVLPVSALTGMPAVQLEALLAHELAHIKRYDYLVNLLQRIAETLLFYHPAVWWMSNIMRRAREECCDDAAVAVCGDAKLYAKALTNLEVLRHRQPPLTLAATDKPLLGRVKRLLGLGEVRHTPSFAMGVFLLLTVLATIVFSLSPPDVAAQSADSASVQPSSLWVSVSPGVTFDDVYTHIAKVFNASAYVLVEARSPTERRTVRVTRGAFDTDFVYTYKVDGKVQPFDKEAQAWFDSSLQTGALGPLKQYVSVQAQMNDDEGGQLSSYLTYDEPTSRYISLVRVADAHLSPDATLTAETDVRKRTLLNVVAHYAAQKLVADREIGAYLKLFIERTRASQLQGLVPDILSIITDIEDKAVKTDVKLALAKRLQGTNRPGQGVVEQTVATQLSTSFITQPKPKRGASINGVVVWNHQRLPNLKVALYDETALETWKTPPALQTTSTNAKGEYKFGDVPPGNYTVWALGSKAGYQDVGYPATSYAETSGYVEVRVDKPIELIGPKATTGVSLTPTLRWKPVPGAVRYEVGLDDVTPPEDLAKGRLYYRTDKPSRELTKPLERNRLYIWSVEAYAEDGTRIASDIEGPTFSTGREEVLRLVKLQGIAASTVLPSNWQESSSNVFTYTNTDGEKGSITFARRSLTELGARGTSGALAQLKQAPRRYNGRDWGLGFDALRDGKLSLITLQDGFAYLITLDGVEYEGATLMTFELAGIIMPTILRNFEISD